MFKLLQFAMTPIITVVIDTLTLKNKDSFLFSLFILFFYFSSDKTVPVERMWVLYLALKGLLGNVKVLCNPVDNIIKTA